MRSRPVTNPDLLDFRATIVVSAAAAVLTIRWMQGVDLSFLTMDYRTWPREPWRLLTACLLHAGVLHLVFNLFWTWRFGAILEPIFGLPAMIGVYLLLGAVSSSVQWGLAGPGVGLSGVGYGLFGLAWALDRHHPSYRGILDPQTTRLFVVWFFVCIFLTVTDVLPIGNEAHGAGALCGGLFGLALSPFPRRRRQGRVGLAALVLVALGVATFARPYVMYTRVRGWELSYDGYVALVAEDYAAAARYLERSVERDPGQERAWHNLGVAYEHLGRRQEAARAFRRAAELSAAPPDEGRSERVPYPDRLRGLGRDEH